MYVFFDKVDVNAFVTPDADSTTDTTPVAGSPIIVKSDSRLALEPLQFQTRKFLVIHSLTPATFYSS